MWITYHGEPNTAYSLADQCSLYLFVCFVRYHDLIVGEADSDVVVVPLDGQLQQEEVALLAEGHGGLAVVPRAVAAVGDGHQPAPLGHSALRPVRAQAGGHRQAGDLGTAVTEWSVQGGTGLCWIARSCWPFPPQKRYCMQDGALVIRLQILV